MKSSSIALLHLPAAGDGAGAPGEGQDGAVADRAARGVLVNLIDSPGHVDFCSEVLSIYMSKCSACVFSTSARCHTEVLAFDKLW